MSQQKPRIGVTLGDLNGIGPEVVIKALSDPRLLTIVTPIIYGSSRVISFYKKQLNIEEFNYTQVKTKGQFAYKNVNVVNCWEDALEINPGKATPEGGKAAVAALKCACEEMKEGYLDGLVTGPLDKKLAHTEEFPFKGHTEYLTQFFGSSNSLMFMISDSLRVGVVTEHVPLQQVSALITRERIEAKLIIMENSLKKDFGISKPKIAILGLNPHAGDGGLIGLEDEQIIKPLVNDYRNKGKLVFGPFPADGLFGSSQYTKYDGILAMYHDQGLIPFKAIAFETGVNFTAGLPIVRTSPDHGTAFGLAGKNQASEVSIREAIYKAGDIFRQRTEPSTEK
jgi:4-hydroxythreonine-4-phosphate dehydrogenase